MSSSLGIYIDENIIKYAKISREGDSLKVDALGIKMYTDLQQTIDQIVSETFSFKIPICVNMSEEMYNYFYMSDLLNKKDLDKAIGTEFESLCYEKQFNPNAIESRYALVNDINEKGRIKVIHVSSNKIKINKILQTFEGKKIGTITPMPISIANIAPLNQKENTLIVNIEDLTTVTILTGQSVYDIKTLQVGAKQFLDSINEKENSYTKAYEICKNTTIYTMEGQELQRNEVENEYLENIIPTLYTIASEVKNIISENLFKINKIYITGTGSVINNIDLYFEEIIDGIKCEILKPFFLEDNRKINMKDYIEVNSATALALQGLGYGIKDINFNKKSFFEKIPEILSADVKFGNKKDKESKGKISFDISTPKAKAWIVRGLTGVVVLSVAYISLASYINIQLNKKEKEIVNVTDDINKQISLIDADKSKIDIKSSEYATITKNLQNAKQQLEYNKSFKYAITTLLSKIMNIIPQQVQLTSIENPSDSKVVINAQSPKYEQLAYFKALLKSEGVLQPKSVVSSEAVKEGNLVKIVIEGELP